MAEFEPGDRVVTKPLRPLIVPLAPWCIPGYFGHVSEVLETKFAGTVVMVDIEGHVDRAIKHLPRSLGARWAFAPGDLEHAD